MPSATSSIQYILTFQLVYIRLYAQKMNIGVSLGQYLFFWCISHHVHQLKSTYTFYYITSQNYSPSVPRSIFVSHLYKKFINEHKLNDKTKCHLFLSKSNNDAMTDRNGCNQNQNLTLKTKTNQGCKSVYFNLLIMLYILVDSIIVWLIGHCIATPPTGFQLRYLYKIPEHSIPLGDTVTY